MPDNTIDIPLSVTLPDVVEIDRSAQATDKLARNNDRLVQSVRSGVGPFERLSQAQRELADAQERGAESADRYADIAYKVQQRQQQVDRILRKAKAIDPDLTQSLPDSVRNRISQLPTGVRERYQNALSLQHSELRRGNVSDARRADLQDAVDRAKSRVDGLNPKSESFSDAAMNLVSRSRFGGTGGGIMPLVKDLKPLISSALGPEAAALAGPVGIAAAAFVVAAKAVYDFTDAAAKSGREFTALRFQTGGSNAETAQLSTLGKALGIDTGQLAASLNDKLTSDPTAMGFANRFGASNIPGPYGKVDTAGNLLKVIEGLRTITNEQERIRTARVLGVESALPLTQVSNSTFGQLKQDAGIQNKVMDPAFQRQSAEFGAAQGRVASGWEAMSAALSKSFFPIVIPFLNGIADTEYAVAAFASGDFKSAFSYAAKAGQDFLAARLNLQVQSSPVGAAAKFGMDLAGGSDGAGNKTDRNTDAMQNLTAALGTLTKMIGGGERARDAVPASLKGAARSRAIETHALRLGTL